MTNSGIKSTQQVSAKRMHSTITEKWKSESLPVLLGKGSSLSQSHAMINVKKLQVDFENFLLFCPTLICWKHSYRYFSPFII